MTVRVKICCIASVDEARLAIEHGASALGLVGPMPSGPGTVAEAVIGEVARFDPPSVPTFLLTCEIEAERIVEHHARCGTSVIQLVDRVTDDTRRRVRETIPAVRLVQVVHVTGPESVDEAVAAASTSDALLLDSGNPGLAVKELGGTGRVHDWSVSRSIRAVVDVPVWLAGGLCAQNVAEAVRLVEPFGVDLCTGVRTDDRLDAAKLEAFFEALGPEALG